MRRFFPSPRAVTPRSRPGDAASRNWQCRRYGLVRVLANNSRRCQMKPLAKITLFGALAALGYGCSTDAPTAFKADVMSDDAPAYGPWGAPVNLGAVVNSPYNDQHPAISKDGLSLYISSTRPAGSYGGTDIWVSRRASIDDPWGPPENLGPNINSAGNDFAPTFTPDGHKMYFHSNGRGGCGLADLFVARRHDKRDDFVWEPAENLGCVVNSAFADAGPTYFEDETMGITTVYFTVQNNPPTSDQGYDIYASTRTGEEGEFGPPAI